MLDKLLEKKKVDPSESRQNFLHIPITIHCCRYWMFREWEFTNMAFPFWRIYHNETEGASVMYQNIITRITADKIIVIPPYTPYSNGFKNHDCMVEKESIIAEKITLDTDISKLQSQQLFDHLFIHFNIGMPYDGVIPGIYIIPVNPQLLSLVNSIKNICRTDMNAFTFEPTLLINSLISQLLTSLPSTIWPIAEQDVRINKVVRFIDRNLNKRIENNELAGIANMATNSFARFFKQNTGETIQYYIFKRRIEKARLMLHHSYESIDTIAAECGFCDRHHFSKIFKIYTSMSPAYYKKNITI
jgi:AraC-like DNA-binding protein